MSSTATAVAPPPRSRRRLWPWVLAASVALLAVLAATIVVVGTHRSPRSRIGPGPVDGTLLVAPVAGTSEGDGPCDGVPAAPLVRLERALPAESVVMCGLAEVDDGGAMAPQTRVLDVASAADEQLVAELVAEYAEPDATFTSWVSGNCLGMLVIVPGVVLTLESGERLRLAVPVDTCGFPLPWADAALERAWDATTPVP